MATTPKAIRYIVNQRPFAAMKTFTGDDTTVDNEWTQLTVTTPGIMTDGTQVVYAQRFNPAVLNSNNFCIFGIATDTFPTSGVTPNDIAPLQVQTGAATLANGANNDITGIASANLVFINGPSAGFSITGIAGGVDGANVTIYNTTAQAMTIANNSGSSAAGNKIITGTGADIVISGLGSVTIEYEASASQWVVTGLSEPAVATTPISILSGSTGTFPSNATKYTPLVGFFTTPANAIDASTENVMPFAGTVKNLYVVVDQVPGGANTVALTIMKNGVATAVTCTIGAAATTAHDTTNSFTVAAGDTLALRFIAGATSACTLGNWSASFNV